MDYRGIIVVPVSICISIRDLLVVQWLCTNVCVCLCLCACLCVIVVAGVFVVVVVVVVCVCGRDKGGERGDDIRVPLYCTTYTKATSQTRIIQH